MTNIFKKAGRFERLRGQSSSEIAAKPELPFTPMGKDATPQKPKPPTKKSSNDDSPDRYRDRHSSAVIEPNHGLRNGRKDSDIHDRDWSRAGFHMIHQREAAAEQAGREGAKGMFAKTPPNVLSAKYAKAYRSWVDTSLGGNFPINTAYRYTRFADINMDRAVPNLGSGMGYYYWDSIERNAHDIHLRFGTMKFSDGFKFFGGWFDYYSYSISTHGRAPSILFDIGGVAGLAVGFVMPQVIMAGWMIKLFGLIGGGRYAYVAPAMPVYWSVVNNIFNEITAALGLTLPPAPSDAAAALSDGVGNPGDLSYIGTATSILPEIYQKASGSTEEGFAIDVRRVASRAQRLENQINKRMQSRLFDVSGSDISWEKLDEIYDAAMAEVTGGGGYGQESSYSSSIGNKSSTRAYLHHYLRTKQGKGDTDELMKHSEMGESNSLKSVIGYSKDSMEDIYDFSDGRNLSLNAKNLTETGVEGENASLWELYKNELNDGSAWLTLRVNGTGSVGESFSNSSEQSQLASTINSWAQQRRQLSFNFMGGALLGKGVDAIINGVTELAAGTLESIGLSGLTGFLLGAKIDIPKVYSSSSASFPNKSYTLKLRAPYKHPLCVAQDLYIPLSCMLAAALPLSNGRNSFGNPFYVELYDRGRNVTKFGLISSLSIERGTSGVGWTHEGLPLGLDISFTVECLDEIAHVPVNTFSKATDFINVGKVIEKIMIGNEGAFADYVSALSGLSLPDQIYRTNTVKRNWWSVKRQFDAFWDKDNFIQRIGSYAPSRMVSLFMTGTARR